MDIVQGVLVGSAGLVLGISLTAGVNSLKPSVQSQVSGSQPISSPVVSPLASPAAQLTPEQQSENDRLWEVKQAQAKHDRLFAACTSMDQGYGVEGGNLSLANEALSLCPWHNDMVAGWKAQRAEAAANEQALNESVADALRLMNSEGKF